MISEKASKFGVVSFFVFSTVKYPVKFLNFNFFKIFISSSFVENSKIFLFLNLELQFTICLMFCSKISKLLYVIRCILTMLFVSSIMEKSLPIFNISILFTRFIYCSVNSFKV